MAKPPLLPINVQKYYFYLLVEDVKPFFQKIGVELVFDGYKETVEEYGNCKHNNYDKMWSLSRDFHMWGEYFTEIHSLTEKFFLDTETQEKKEFALASLNADKVKVSTGDRLANKDEFVISLRRQKNQLKAFLTMLEAKIDTAYKAHHHCKATCNWLKSNKANDLLN